MALLAGATGAPYIPTRSLLGTGLLESNPRFRADRDPWSGAPVVLVPALLPDVAMLPCSAPTARGARTRGGLWGSRGRPRSPRAG